MRGQYYIPGPAPLVTQHRLQAEDLTQEDAGGHRQLVEDSQSSSEVEGRDLTDVDRDQDGVEARREPHHQPPHQQDLPGHEGLGRGHGDPAHHPHHLAEDQTLLPAQLVRHQAAHHGPQHAAHDEGRGDDGEDDVGAALVQEGPVVLVVARVTELPTHQCVALSLVGSPPEPGL